MLLPRQIGEHRLTVGRVGRQHHVPGAGQAVVGCLRVAHLLDRPADKLINITGVVGEQHKRLEMFHAGAGVVAQTGQREIGAQRVEVGERKLSVGVEQPVGGLIPNLRQLGGREVACDTGAHGAIQREIGAVNHVGIGDLLAGRHHVNLQLILLLQHRQLFRNVVAQQRRAGNGGAVTARMRKASPGTRAILLRAVTAPGDAQLRVNKQSLLPGVGIGQRAVFGKGFNRRTQCIDRATVKAFKFIQRLLAGQVFP